METSKLRSVCVVLHSSCLLRSLLGSGGLDKDSLNLNLFNADLKELDGTDSLAVSPDIRSTA